MNRAGNVDPADTEPISLLNSSADDGDISAWLVATAVPTVERGELVHVESQSGRSSPLGLINWSWFRSHRQGVGSWCGSGLFHTLLVVLLAFLWMSPPRERSGVLLTGEADPRDQIELLPIRIPSTKVAPREDGREAESVEPLPERAPQPPSPPTAETEGEPLADTTSVAIASAAPEPSFEPVAPKAEEVVDAPASQPAPTPAAEQVRESEQVSLSQPSEEERIGEEQIEEPAGGQQQRPSEAAASRYGVQFFGIESAGSRFVFLIDCSWSMKGLRWERATRELLHAVKSLEQDQLFYVMFFDVATHRMFDVEQPEADFVPATEENVQRLVDWIPQITMGYETEPADAVQTALDLKPDAIYLLSDGEFDPKTQAQLRRDNWEDPVVVHTISLHSQKGQRMLQQIAKENHGIYRYVADTTPPARVFARERSDGSDLQAIHALIARGAQFAVDDTQRIRSVLYGGGDEGLQHLAGLKNLRELWLAGSHVSDAGLAVIARYHALELLSLSSCDVSDQGIAALASLRELEALFLDGTEVTSAGLRFVSTLPRLEALSTPGNLTDDDLVRLQEFSSLKTLFLIEPAVTDEGLAWLKTLPQLEVLELRNAGIDGSGLAHLLPLNNLRELSLAGTQITNPTLAYLGPLQNLRTLHLQRTAISDNALNYLVQLKQLELILVAETGLSRHGIDQLRQQFPQVDDTTLPPE